IIFFSSRRRHTRFSRDWSSDVCSSDLNEEDEEKVKKELEKKIKAKNVTDNAVKRERIERRITTLFNNPREITFNDLPTQGAFEYLVECFDRYSQNNSTELKFDVDLWK